MELGQRSLLWLSTSFLCIFTSYSALQNLQTSLSLGFVGSISLGAMYFMSMVSSVFGPSVLEKVGIIRCFRLAMFGFLCFNIVNVFVSYYPSTPWIHWTFLLPSSVLTGICATFLWISLFSFLSKLSTRTSLSLGEINSTFWGIYEFSQVSGNVAASLLMRGEHWDITKVFWFYSGFSILGNILVWKVTLPSTNGYNSSASIQEEQSLLLFKKKSPVVDFIHILLFDRRMTALVPLCIFMGMQQGFIWGDFTSHFVTPTLGRGAIGYILGTFGIVNQLSAFLTGKACAAGITPTVLFTLVAILLLSSYVTLLCFSSTSFNDATLYWIILTGCATCAGIGNAVLSTTLCVTIGIIFKTNPTPAYSVSKFLQTGGVSLAFFYTPYVTDPETRICILLLSLVLGISVYHYLMNRGGSCSHAAY